MSGINLSYARPQSLYAGSPIDEFKTLADTASSQYANNRADKDQLDILYNNLPLEERNNPIKLRAIQGLKERFKQLAQSGNYEDAQYAIQDAKKAFMTDRELQDAIKSKQLHDADITQLQDRLKKGLSGEKGGISQKQYDYAIKQSKINNQKPLKYSPDKMLSENMYNNINVSDDLSSEIQDDLNKFQEGWKANGTITIDGKQYDRKVDKLTGVERVLVDGKEVPYSEVADAMKQYVINKEPYKNYLDESRNIDKFNRTFGSNTGQQRSLNRQEDLSGITDQELLDTHRGATEEQIKSLAKSGSLSDKATLEEIKNKQKEFDLNNPDIVEGLYDKLTSRDQLNNVVYPAAEKASFKDFENHIFTDHAALEAIKQGNAMNLEKFKKKLADNNMPPLMQSYSQANLFTGEDFSKKKENISVLQNQIQQAKELMSKTDPKSSLYRTRVDDYNSLVGQMNIANSEIKNFYSSIPQETKDKIKDKIGDMFDPNLGWTNRDNRISIGAIDKLIKEASMNKDSQTQAALGIVKSSLANSKQIPEYTLNYLKSSLVDNPDYLGIISNEDNNIASRSPYASTDMPNSDSGFEAKDDPSFVGNIFGALSYRTTVDNILTKSFNDKVSDQSLKLYSIPSLDGLEDKKNIPGMTKQFYSYARNVLSNASDLVTSDGTPLDAVIGGKSDKQFYKLDNKGKYVQALPDYGKESVSLATGSKDGQKRLSVTYYDKDGSPLVLSDGTPDDKSARTAVVISARNPETLTPLYNMASQYASSNNQDKESLELQGELHFGNILNKARLGTNVDPFEINFPASKRYPNGSNMMVSFRKDADDASTIIDMTPYINGISNPNYGKPLWGDHSTFRSNSDLLRALEQSMR